MKTDIFKTFCYLSPQKTKKKNILATKSKEKFFETRMLKKKKIHKKKKFDIESIKKSLNFDKLCKIIIFDKIERKKNLKRIFFSKKEKIIHINKIR